MPAVSWLDLDAVHRDLITGRLKAVGWGAGGSFRLALLDCPVRPACLIDSDPAKGGTTVFGIPVRGPEALAAEDPATTVVIIYSVYFFGVEIARQIEAIGPFRYIAPFAPSFAFPQLQRFKAVLAAPPPPRPILSDKSGIVVQGGVVPELTELVLRYHRAAHPAAPVILSVWEETDPALLERLRPWCDRLVLNARPSAGGQGNRNFQLVSTRGGLEAARAMGLAKVLKTRTDLVVMAADVLELGARLQALHPPPAGGRNRIITSGRYTQKYIPYNISDIILFGDTEDLLLYFSAPLDVRPFAIHSPEYRRDTSLGRYSRDRAIPEVYFATHYLTAVGWKVEGTLADYWAALADHWLVVDDEWFDLFWPKYGILPVTRQTHDRSPRRTVDHAFWQRLAFGLDVSADLAAVDVETVLFDDFFRLQLSERGV